MHLEKSKQEESKQERTLAHGVGVILNLRQRKIKLFSKI
jgi:hypothetical protein